MLLISTAITGAPSAERQDGDLISLINEKRSEAGCAPMTDDGALAAAAQRHAADMRYNGVRDHVGSDGSTPGDRISQSGFAAVATGEILYWSTGGGGAYDAVGAWMDSKGHRAIIQDCAFNYIGTASIAEDGQYFAVAEFAQA